MSLSFILFPWRWSSCEFFLLLRLVTWRCSPGRDLDIVHGEKTEEKKKRERGWLGERARASERLCDYITVITQRLNSRPVSFGVCGGKLFFCVQRSWAHILFGRRKERETRGRLCVTSMHVWRDRVMKGHIKKDGASPPGWGGWTVSGAESGESTLRYDTAVRLCKRCRGRIWKQAHPAGLKGLKLPWGHKTLTDATGHKQGR